MRTFYVILEFIFSFLFLSCENNQKVIIKGSCKNYIDGSKVELSFIRDDSIIIQDTVRLYNGKFKFCIEENQDRAYYITILDSINAKNATLFAEKGIINVCFDSVYHLSGTPLNDLYNKYLNETRRMENLGEMEYHRSIEGRDNPDTSVYDSLLQAYTEYKVKFQLDNIHNIVGRTIFINEIGSVYDPHFLETYPTLPEDVKANKNVQWYYELRLEMDRKQKELEAKIGTKITDLEFPDVHGVTRKLSSFIPKNGYLYIDLWSSGCAPCIAEFPELEKTYSQYKEKGLNILLISIDKNLGDFQTAMKKHQIKFNSLVDTTEGQKVKENFPFDGIPHGILINCKGVIVANQLHSTLLKKRMSELVDEKSK